MFSACSNGLPVALVVVLIIVQTSYMVIDTSSSLLLQFFPFKASSYSALVALSVAPFDRSHLLRPPICTLLHFVPGTWEAVLFTLRVNISPQGEHLVNAMY